ncbi:ATP-dependent helicase [Duganella sp. LX47W]|uniref:DNA 3'-5' helicase II n=2 Tax=Rugamonas apoptosis TaxID=2758570 RepID=A0A7W2F7S2_9BURK|nr:ATP-dependent helicase [Rugamonas apoptosis]
MPPMENSAQQKSPAVLAAEESLGKIYGCVNAGKSFLLEAGAGSGKTHSLVMALRYLIVSRGAQLARRNEKIACITFTNVASDEIKSRTDGHPVIFSSTIHAFCWSLIKDFQGFMREELPKLPDWEERLEEGGGIAGRAIAYELGFPSAKRDEKEITLHHDDVLALMVKLMGMPKFRRLLVSRYPVVFIDEYQDTNKHFVQALREHFIGKEGSPLLGFFGDHWQCIYGEDGCGKIEDDSLTLVEQKANFRSVRPIVEALNEMRPELPQAFSDPESKGQAMVFHTNGWAGKRRSGAGGHWTGDLPAEDAHAHLEALREKLGGEGWDFSERKTKILMLTHGVLASEQGYSGIAKAFLGRPGAYSKKEDKLVKFLLEIVEPVCSAYEGKRFGEMFLALGTGTPAIRSHADKAEWAKDMDELLALRAKGSIGNVIDHLKETRRPRLPDSIERNERELAQWTVGGVDEPSSSVKRLSDLRKVPYAEVVALAKFVDDHTPFSTKHGVKGAQFENVIVVAGRGWNHYDFNKLLEWLEDPASVPADRTAYERNRNLFYVACSRPKKRLAVLFTQKLSDPALDRLCKLFGKENVQAFDA